MLKRRESGSSEAQRSPQIFLSYAHEDTAVVEATADSLSTLGLMSFLATRHIKPAREWLPRLERELTASTALAAFLSPAFRASAWTDQEVGYALAKKKQILPIQLEQSSAPHGFMERYQSMPAGNMTPQEIAIAIFDSLLNNSEVNQQLKPIVISNLRSQRSEDVLRMWAARAARISRPSESDMTSITAAVVANSLIATNTKLQKDINAVIQLLSARNEHESS